MGRKSKLTPEQWQEVDRRLAKGDAGRAIARDFGISESQIRARGKEGQKIKDVAQQLVSARHALASLPISAQITAQTLAAQFEMVAGNMMSVAVLQSGSAHRLASLANSVLATVDDADPLMTATSLKTGIMLADAATDAARVPMGLMTIAKDGFKQRTQRAPGTGPDGQPIETIIPDDPVEASRVYRELMNS